MIIIQLKWYIFFPEINWLTDFIKERKQKIVLGLYQSEWKEVLSDVSKGAVLGPLLFVIYINDMPQVVKQLLKLFADDSKLITRIKIRFDVQNIQEGIDSLVD